ncbi:hypothetical protein [Terrabacter sp. RAF57]|jgi:hypothetical protein|uniref:hypothetical protein n=1 Tax=Terrabacter sp. RAF57 TaxID=3233063 RepID=UPI003F953FCC
MALSKKITKAVKDAQKQAEAAVADVRGQLVQVEGRMPEVQVDPTPFYAVVGAANIAIDTVRTAGEQLEVARKQAKSVDLRKGAKKEADQMQKDLQKRIIDLQGRTTALQKLATTYAERFVTGAQDLPARVLNEGLVIASNAKDQYDAAAARGEKVVTDLRAQGERTAFGLAERGTATVTRGRRVAETAVSEGEKVAKTLKGAVVKDASKLGSQVSASVDAVESAAAPVPAKRTAAHQTAIRKSAAQKSAATRKANEVEATTTRKVAARSAATTDDPQATVARKVAPAKKAARKTATKTATKTAAATKSATKTAAKKATPAKKTAQKASTATSTTSTTAPSA